VIKSDLISRRINKKVTAGLYCAYKVTIGDAGKKNVLEIVKLKQVDVQFFEEVVSIV
jgi:hypothetical protein